MLLVSFADFDDLVLDFLICSSLGKDMLAADPLDGLAHHGCSAHVDEDVAELADCRVACDAGSCVGTAALDAKEEFRGVEPFFRLHCRFRCHVSCGADCLLDCLECAALILNSEGDDRLACHGLDLLFELLVRDCLAAEADDDNAVDVRVAGEAGEDFLAHGCIGSNI